MQRAAARVVHLAVPYFIRSYKSGASMSRVALSDGRGPTEPFAASELKSTIALKTGH